MKYIYNIVILFCISIFSYAQTERKFDPEKFNKDQEAYITKEAQLTPHEAKKFFPIFNEMQQKQRPLFKEMRQTYKTKPSDDKEAAELINKRDQLDMQIKKIQSCYHQKLCKVISPTKVYKCLQAEERFKHRIMDGFSKRKNKRTTKKQHKK